MSLLYKIINRSALALIILSTTVSCYRMPTEDDYSVIPMTNSPDFTREGENPLLPNTNY